MGDTSPGERTDTQIGTGVPLCVAQRQGGTHNGEGGNQNRASPALRGGVQLRLWGEGAMAVEPPGVAVGEEETASGR